MALDLGQVASCIVIMMTWPPLGGDYCSKILGVLHCAKVLEEECIRMFGTKSLDDEHDCNVFSMNSLNIRDANVMQSLKLGDAYV